MDKYNTSLMRSCAQDIRSEMQNKYGRAATELTSIITNLKANWNDTTNQKLSQKYVNNAQPSAENLKKLMESYATLLEQSAEQIEMLHQKAKQDMGE